MTAFPHDIVVVPIDFSEASEKALKVALEITGGDVSKLKLIHVMAPLEVISPMSIWGEYSEKNRQEEIHKFAKSFLESHGVGDATFTISYGSLGLEITDFARNQDADLIVISSHGYHGVKRVLLGSVAETILRHAHCPVLVLRRQDAE